MADQSNGPIWQNDNGLMARVMATIAQKCRRARGRKYMWDMVSDVFVLGSTYSALLCRRFGYHPDTGEIIEREASNG